MGKLINSLNFLNVNLFDIIDIDLNVWKQMTGVNLLLLHSNSSNHLTVCKQRSKSERNDSYLIKILEIIKLWRKMGSGLFKMLFERCSHTMCT